MSRLPTPGRDDDVWGDILNDFLKVAHNPDGTVQTAAISAAISNGAIDSSKISGLPSSLPPSGSAGGDLSGTYPSPTVTSTHLGSALPVNQGGTGSNTQNFVDLSTDQAVAGVKTFSSSPIVPTPTTTAQAASKSYVDAKVGSVVSGVSSVNSQAGAVTLTAGNVGADASGAATTAQTNAEAYTDSKFANVPLFILESNGTYTARSTVTSSISQVVIWIGPDAPAVGGNGAVDGVDVWWRTP